MPWWEPFVDTWDWYVTNREVLTPIGAFLGGGIIAWAALRQARTATRQAAIAAQQAETARLRHEEQTKSDKQRRITESFSKAIEQLGNDKIEVRLGGIYTLEQISRESDSEYWSVMEILTAFVREHAHWKELSQTEWQALVMSYANAATRSPQHTTATDITAVFSVIRRRSARNRALEKEENWQFDLSGVDLREVDLREAHLE
jgi:hypothetical protein